MKIENKNQGVNFVTEEEINDAKKKLEDAINREFARPEGESRFLEENRFDDLAILLTSEVSRQNIHPAWLIKRIENGCSLEDVLEHAKEANNRKERINQLIAACYKLQDLCRK